MEIFGRTFHQLHGAIGLELTAGRSRKYTNVDCLSSDLTPEPSCLPKLSSRTLSEIRWRVCLWLVEYRRMHTEREGAGVAGSGESMRYHDPGKIRVGGGGGGRLRVLRMFTVHISSNACLTEWASGD